MSFIWAPLLVLLALIPPGMALYVVLERRRRARVAAFGRLGTSSTAPAGRAGIRRRAPAAFFLLGLTIMTVGLARPQGQVSLPTLEGTVILAFDVSGSMAAPDLQPTRMEAAKAAAKDFVERQPQGVVVGVVAFSDGGIAVQAPTSDQAAVLAAINRLNPQRGTSLGQGILASIKAIDDASAPAAQGYYTNQSPVPTPTPTPVAPGSRGSALIVLLTDGENNENPDPLTVAQTAADRGVRIDTIGLGSTAGATLKINGFNVHTQLNEDLLKQVSQITAGAYYSATDAQSLKSIYDNLSPELVIKPQSLELTPIFAGAGIVALLIGGLLSLFWLGRLP